MMVPVRTAPWIECCERAAGSQNRRWRRKTATDAHRPYLYGKLRG